VSEHRKRVESCDKVADVCRFGLVKSSAATVDLRARVKADPSLAPVETPVPVQVSSVAAAPRVWCPVLPPVTVLVVRVLVPIRVG